MLRMIPNAFTWTFSIMDGAVRVAHAVDRSWWSATADLTVQGVAYTARREGLVSGQFLLESAAGIVARATKPSALLRSFRIEHAERRYTLRAPSALRRELVLFDGTTRLGSVSPEGVFTRRAAVDLPSALPLAVRVFIVWLTVVIWKHHNGS